MPQQVVKRVTENAHARLILNRPEKRNAIDGEVIEALGKHLDEIAFDDEVRVISISGEGPAFSSGIDIGFISGLGAIDENQRGVRLRELARKIQAVMNRIENIEKPVVAVIHQYAIGLAMELALACDFRVAAKNAVMGLPEIVLGLVPDCGGTTRLTRAVGVPKAKELVMLGEQIGMEEAFRLGLVNVVADEKDLWSAARDLIDRLIQRPARALGLSKRLVDLSASVDEMTSFEIETLVQTGALAAPDFPQILAEGFQNLRKKK